MAREQTLGDEMEMRAYAPAMPVAVPDPTMEHLDDGRVRKRRDYCMKQEIESWRREQRARRF